MTTVPLWKTILYDQALLNGIVFLLFSSFGTFLARVRKWLEDEIPFPLNRRMLGAVIANIGTSAGLVGSGVFSTANVGLVMFAGLAVGLGTDLINKSVRKEWEPEERKEKVKPA